MSALWLTTAEADTYFGTRLNTDNWDASGVDKTAALTTAQAMIENSPTYTGFPTTATQAMQDAVCEQTLFILNAPEWEDRSSLQEQGVLRAGVLKEQYTWTPNLPISAMAHGLLYSYVIQKGAYLISIARDDDDAV